MRLNIPVSQNEHPISDTESIVSTTDLQGNITYANPYFIEVSGFTADELIGAPQNIVRHPDMPVEAFADLWSTVKSGLPWTGIVKNRCKNGDYYWVCANVTPVIEEGKPVGYMSVRTKPSPQQISDAKKLYAELKNGNPNNIRLHQGGARSNNFIARLRSRFRFSINHHLALTAALMVTSFIFTLICNFVTINPATESQWLTGLLFLSTFSALSSWYNFHRAVTIPSRRALEACKIMAGGDLTGEINTSRTDDLGQVLRMLRQLRINLHSIVGDVLKNAEKIGLATKEIAAGNLDLSSRTESQASSLEETAASMEQFASTVSQNSDNATQASTMANEALHIAGSGGKISDQMVATMDDISHSSKRMIEITGIIEGIAFQTNILALNAAVEAARAGEQGRGFAVVASEVRNLAQRSASASKEIKELIDESMQKIQTGSSLTSNVGGAMREIITTTEKVTGVMGEIASASQEQRAGILQVNDAVTLMDEVTQQNAALVEEAAAAAASLETQTATLVSALSVFKLTHRSSQTSAKHVSYAQQSRTKAVPRSTSVKKRQSVAQIEQLS